MVRDLRLLVELKLKEAGVEVSGIRNFWSCAVMPYRIAITACVLLCSMNLQAMEKAAYDRDGNEVIDLVEYARYVLDLHSPPLSHFDENLDGRIEGPEQEQAAEALLELEASVSPCVDDFSVDFPERFMVRASTEDLILFRPRSEDVRRGAMFSLARDLNRSINIASVKGAIIRPINLVDADSEKDARTHWLSRQNCNRGHSSQASIRQS